MRQRILRTCLLPPVLVAASVLAGIGCGIVNPELTGVAGTASGLTAVTDGNVVILVVNDTTVTGQANVTVSKTTGSSLSLNIPVAANSHAALVQNCDVTTITVDQASYASAAAGAVVIPATVSPIQMGLTIQCGGVVAISISGTPPGVFLNVQTF